MKYNSKFYPKLLVFLQFTFIIAMLIFLKYTNNSYITILSLSIFAIGCYIGIWALKHNQLGNFHIQPKLRDNAKLITTGIYKYIRHPMYFSVVLMMFSVLLYTPSFKEMSLFVLLIITLMLKAKKEEDLWMEYDQSYLSYKNRTKLIIPFVF
jgi:protein-S-isoprenylcysteine O-methyltransferase Ste14